MEHVKNMNIKRVGLLVLLLLLGWGVFIFYENLHFRIISTSPGPNQMSIWTPIFKIELNKPVSNSGTSITVSPDIIYNHKVTVSGKTVTVYLNVPLDSTKTYTIDIHNITSTSGQKITDKHFTFNPIQNDRGNLPDDQREELIRRNQQSDIYSDPILANLPYRNVDFSLVSSFGTSNNNQPSLNLQAQLLIHAAQSGDKAAAVASGKQEVVDYITSLGLDPNKYKIRYTILGP